MSSNGNLCCPSCKKMFSMPRRYVTQEYFSDIAYLPLPRVLTCLHTICQSCLDEQWQQNGETNIICPICSHVEQIGNIITLPLNLKVAQQMNELQNSLPMKFCCQCYDEVKCFSWCFTCCTGLCEFHHQDHKLSFDTAKHVVHTLQEVKFRKLIPQSHVSPLFCPEIPGKDCNLYCHTCKYLISIEAAQTHHNGHPTTPYRELYDVKVKARLETISSDSITRISKLEHINDELQADVNILLPAHVKAIESIDKEFDNLIETLNARRKLLKSKVDEIANKKRSLIEDKIKIMNEMLDDSKRIVELVEVLLPKTVLSDDESNQLVREMYSVASLHSIHACSSNIKRRVKETSFSRPVMPKVSAIFNVEDIDEIRDKVSSLGAIGTYELKSILKGDVGSGQDESAEASEYVASVDAALPDSIQGSLRNSPRLSEVSTVQSRKGHEDNSLPHAPEFQHHSRHSDASHRHHSTARRRSSFSQSFDPGALLGQRKEEGPQRFTLTMRSRYDTTRNCNVFVVEVHQQTLEANSKLTKLNKAQQDSVHFVSMRQNENDMPKTEAVQSNDGANDMLVKQDVIVSQVVFTKEIDPSLMNQIESRRYVESAAYHGVPFMNILEHISAMET